MIGWTALVITLGILAMVAFRIDDWSRDLTKNSASLDINAKRPELRPVELDADAEEAMHRIKRWADSESKWELVSVAKQGEATLKLKLTRKTPILGFIDDVDLSIEEQTIGSVIVTATSRSRIGKGDLGQNPRNLVELTAALRRQ